MKQKKLKVFVITVSKRFPTTHERKGERTSFVCKILHATNFDDAGNGLYRICSNECETSCYRRLIDPKIHTIRSNYPFWKKRIDQVQDGSAILSIRYWSGKPYNSKQVEICQLTKDDGVGVQKLEFDGIDDFDQIIRSIDLSKNDGLSLDDFKEWFRGYDLSEPMAIIHFTKFRY